MSEFEKYAEQLKSHKASTRANAALKLGRLGNVAAIRWLEESLGDSISIVRCYSASALGELNDPRALTLLVSSLNDPDDQVYGHVASALHRIGNDQAISVLVNEVLQQENRRRSIATNNLIKIGQPAVPALIDGFNNSSGKTRAYFLKALGKIDDKGGLELFRNALNDDVYDVFWVATAIQRTIRDPKAIPIMVALLDHEDPWRQIRAANTLGSVGDHRAIEPLKKVVNDKKRQENVRCQAMLALGYIGRSEAVNTLLCVLEEQNPRIHISALMALSYTGDARAVGPLASLANQHPQDIQYHNAIRNLATTGDKSTLEKLENILRQKDHNDLRVQQTVEETLRQINERLNQQGNS